MATKSSASFAARWWSQTPLVIRAIAVGLAVLFGGIYPWSALASLNLKFGSVVPWAVPAMAVYLAGLFTYLNGWGWPKDTSDARRTNLRAYGLSARVWFWSLAAGGVAAAGLLALFMVSLRLGQVPPAEFDEYRQLARYPAWSVLAWLAMAAVVAGAVEEAAFRGYMQAPLERRVVRRLPLRDAADVRASPGGTLRPPAFPVRRGTRRRASAARPATSASPPRTTTTRSGRSRRTARPCCRGN